MMLRCGLARFSVSQVVSLGSIQLTIGLQATRDIEPGTFIMDTCSSTAVNPMDVGGEYVIATNIGQPGDYSTEGRIIIGPLRLVRHDCNPNAEVRTMAPVKLKGIELIVRLIDIRLQRRLRRRVASYNRYRTRH